jgi:hypothetical protein
MADRSSELTWVRVRRIAGKVVAACDTALVALTVWDVAGTDAAPLAISITKGAVSVVRLVALRLSTPPRT